VGVGSADNYEVHAYCYTPPKRKGKGKGKKGNEAAAAKKRKKKKGPRALTVMTAVGTLPAPAFSSGSVTAPACERHLRTISGGFAAPPAGPTSVALFNESRIAAGGWRASAVQGGSPSPALLLTAYNDCA
jgi:hypothetical protein